MDDSKTVLLALKSGDDVKGWLNLQQPDLLVQCVEKKVGVYFEPHMSAQPELGLFEQATVRFRLDSTPAKSIHAAQATNGSALHLGDVGFLRQLLSAKQLAVQFTPFNSDPASATFDLGDLPTSIGPIKEACPSARL
ncbi:MAG TPA: hypothetical protein VHY84_26695 [Bryobacteraceae bacterium]|jgi:hypothetical protein|nr:hypothetical protein [Bryobacteraceae bacterium]